MLVALNDHPVSRRLKTPTSYLQATDKPTCSRPATATFHFDALFRTTIINTNKKTICYLR